MTDHPGQTLNTDKPRRRVGTVEPLTVVADLGPNWPAQTGDHELIDAFRSSRPELLAGTSPTRSSSPPRTAGCSQHRATPTPTWHDTGIVSKGYR